MSVLRKFGNGRLATVALAVVALAITANTADAARKRPSRAAPQKASESSSDIGDSGRYAAFVLDANTGKVLFDRNGAAQRHPASLTKMMTLYVLFEELERGRVKLDSPLQVSARAASQSPSKLYLKPGQTIEVEDAIKAIVTRSANDVAVVIAENIGGSEESFAERMTQTARRLGMTTSTFYNASGLPNPRQITSARDMVILGESLQERFPTYYRYFNTRSFAWGGGTIGNHNRLLGRVEGVDGIKTGYTQASGFNLVSSVRRDGRHVVAAVMGGPTGNARDRHMEKLLATYVPQASTGGKTVSIAAFARRSGSVDSGPVGAEPTVRVATSSAPVRITADDTVIATPSPKATVERGAAVAMARAILLPDAGNQTAAAPQPVPVAAPVRAAAAAMPAPQAPVLPQKPVVIAMATETGLPPKSAERLPGADAPRVRSLAEATISTRDVADYVETATVKPKLVTQPDRQVASVKVTSAPTPAPQATPIASGATGAWVIQITATDSEASAKAVLSKAQAQVKTALNGRTPYTEATGKGAGTLYRARFGGFEDQAKANAACAALKKSSFSCLAIKN